VERRVVDIVRAERPDLILMTGDYMNQQGAQAGFVEFLAALEAPVYGVAGNWDGKFPVAELFENGKAKLLRDDYESVAGGDILLVGLDYVQHRSARELVAGASPASYKILMHHSPDAVDSLGGAPFDLFLCGHTHGGQVRLPFYGAVLTMTQQGKRFEMGRYFIAPPATGNPAGTGMYVNRGIGCSGAGPRVRFLCRPEVAVIELVAR
jgi:predicted MPP superfamily phosphohydrolase